MTHTEYPASTMTPATTPEDPAEGYALVEKLIYSQIHKFRKRYGGDMEELVGDAHLLFLNGHRQYKTGKANSGREYTDPYATEVCRWIWYGLFDNMRIQLERDRIAPMTPLEAWHDKGSQNDFNLEEFIEDLSIPAQVAIRLLFEDSPGVDGPAMAKGGSPTKWRSAIRKELKRQGWTADRINEAFDEIDAALSEIQNGC